MSFHPDEVRAAYDNFVAVGDSGDWNAWADLHTVDGLWVEHHLGTFRGREEIRQAIVDVMAQAPSTMEFPIEWVVIDGNRVVYYPWQVLPRHDWWRAIPLAASSLNMQEMASSLTRGRLQPH